MSQPSFNPPWFVRKDLDGFFGLMIDNLIQLILIVSLCRELIHLPDSYIFGRILPGAAISILVGNLFYAWQARQLARETGREDVTALPYGINTVSLFAFVFFIMLPIYQETKDPVWAWKVGLVACFLNGVIEILGAFVAESVRRVTPRAALLSALAGIAITFISMDFTFKIFAQPLVAMVPMAIIFVAYFSHQKLPLGLPGGLIAIAIGTLLGWLLGTMSGKSSPFSFAIAMPVFAGGSLWEALTRSGVLELLLGYSPHGDFQCRRLAPKHRKRRGGGRPLPHVSVAYGERNRFGSRGAARQRIRHHDLHRPSRLEAARRPLRLFCIKRSVHQFYLPYRHDSGGAQFDSARSRNRYPTLHRYHYRGAVVSGNAKGARTGSGVGHRAVVGCLGLIDAGDRFESGRKITVRCRLGAVHPESGDPRHDLPGTRVHL